MAGKRLSVGCSLLLGLACAGCGPYLKNRADDLTDLVEFGFTVSKKPYFAFLPMDYFNATPLGYSRIKGRFIGLWNRHWGSRELKDNTWGVLLYGRQTLQYGDFNPEDPRQVPPEKLAKWKAEGKPLPTNAPRYKIGLVPALRGDDLPSYPSPYSCRRNIHLGWIGWSASMHADEMFDFVMGCFGGDPMKDDVHGKPRAEEARRSE